MLSLGEEPSEFEMLQKPETTMDDLLAKASNLTVLDEDGWEINEVGGDVAGGHCAKARFCSNRPMSRPLLKTILGRVWGIADNKWGVEIKHANKHSSFLLFTFKCAQELNRILGKSPWFLNYGTLILERMESFPQDWEKELLRFPICGRVLHLPSRSITQSNLNRLASLAGEVIDVQVADTPRIFGAISPNHYSQASYFLQMEERNGSLSGHDTRVCAETPKMFEDGLGNWKPSYGPWLKVDDKREAKIYSKSDNNVLLQKKDKGPVLTEEEPSSSAMKLPGLGVEVQAASKVSPGNLMDVNMGLFLSGSIGKCTDNLTVQRNNKMQKVEKGETSQGLVALDTDNAFDSVCLRKGRPGANIDHLNLVEVPISYDADLLFYLWGKLPKRELLQLIGLSWLIWQRRNKLIFKHKAQEIHSWVRWALEQLDEFFGEIPSSRQDRLVKAKQKWVPPPNDFVIINTNASLMVDKLGCGLSVVIRDLAGIVSVYLAEVVAVHLGVCLAHRWVVSKEIVASDCLGMINGLLLGSTTSSDWGMLGREILDLKHHFLSLKFTYVPRDCNGVANALAIWSRMTHSSCIWTDSLPSCAAASFLADKPDKSLPLENMHETILPFN
ncbi:hypothetical protein G4B88_030172 [Cannabis sativa]|uniref:RNase H type-1 domain-containing protein n=1 Tax=Cannabis sativa TaxID=3483 RepID=A0A7J6E561_CANSA|nr:hypothetical protein G4B88_030172 [Cannabis sativa]